MNNQIIVKTKTQKLSGLIELAMNSQLHLPGLEPVYKISGDVLEMHVKKSGTSNENYRLSMINCGFVMTCIKKAILELSHVPLIQTFPNMMEPSLVAFIRIQKRNPIYDLNDPAQAGPDPIMEKSNEAWLKALKQKLSGYKNSITEYTQPAKVNQIMEACSRDHFLPDGLANGQNAWNLTFPSSPNCNRESGTANRIWLINSSNNNAISWFSAGKILGYLNLLCDKDALQHVFDVNLVGNPVLRSHLSKNFSSGGHTQLLLKHTHCK